MDTYVLEARDLLADVRAIPGVDVAAQAEIVPLSDSGWNRFIGIPEIGSVES